MVDTFTPKQTIAAAVLLYAHDAEFKSKVEKRVTLIVDGLNEAAKDDGLDETAPKDFKNAVLIAVCVSVYLEDHHVV